jgi:hypothetical protein
VENKFMVIIFLLVFLLLFNVAGNWIVNSSLIDNTQEQTTANQEFTIENVDIKIVNKGQYSEKIVDTVGASIKQAAKTILIKTNETLTPNKAVKITLAKSDAETVNFPAYSTATIYDPDELILEEWNFYETMLNALFTKKTDAHPFLTIGVGEYFFYKNRNEEIYSSHEMWIAHQRETSPPKLKDLMNNDYFVKKVQQVVEKEGPIEATEAGYWKIASFSQYLIDQHGLERFINLYNGTGDLEQDIEASYGKSLVELEKDWNSYTQSLETAFPAKFNYQLAEDYKYWYEN